MTGRGWPLDETNAKLEFQYMWPFTTLNYVVDLGKKYEFVLIGHPNRKKLWILSRDPVLDEKVFRRLVEEANNLEFPVDKLIKTYHGEDCIYVKDL
jgi:apolipoprotein D and lipocalin family protein